MRPLTPRDRRALIVGIAVIGTSITFARVVPARRDAERELRDRILATARAAHAVQRESDLLRAALAEAKARGAAGSAQRRSLAFDGETPTAVGAQAAQYFGGLARLLGASVHSVAPTADSSFADGVARLTIRAHFSTDGVGLYQLIDELGQGSRLTAVQFLQVSLGNPSAPRSEPEALRVEIGLTAFGRFSPGGAR